jgi:hypothetical protein
MSYSPWIGVDLDGTLAHYDDFKGIAHIGEPIKPMVDRVKAWLVEGMTVKIFTARVSTTKDDRDPEEARKHIQDWCEKHIGQRLEVTNVKDFGLIELWDDRAVQVRRNIGTPVI